MKTHKEKVAFMIEETKKKGGKKKAVKKGEK